MNPKRRFFQIHLSTAMVLMLVAGVLVWANVSEGRMKWLPYYIERYYGWPLRVKETSPAPQPALKNELHFDGRTFISIKQVPRHPVNTEGWWGSFSIENAIGNFVISLAILLSVCIVCEWLIRRRAVPLQKTL